MTVDFFNKFDSLYNEAVSNYETSRFTDAAKNFDYIANFCVKEGLLEDFVYFSYRSAIAWRSSNHINKLIPLYQGFGKITLSYARQLVEKQLEIETDTHTTSLVFFSETQLLGGLCILIQDNECGDWGYSPVDFSGPAGVPDCEVNLFDIASFAAEWLICTTPHTPGCTDVYKP